jgi:hypothetical protein
MSWHGDCTELLEQAQHVHIQPGFHELAVLDAVDNDAWNGHLCETWFSLLARRFDILIERKEIGRIISVLEGNQPLVVVPVSCSRPSLSLVAQEVDVDPAAATRFQCPPACARPCDMPLPFALIPGSNDADDICFIP